MRATYNVGFDKVNVGDMANILSGAKLQPRAAVWPVIIAHLAAGIYYLAIKLAFGQS